MMLLVCGLSAAEFAVAGERPAAKGTEVAALAAPSIAGRWSGQPYAIKNDPERCGRAGCTLVLDIVACAGGWCGIEVDQKNACGAEALQLKTHRDAKRTAAFEGKLSLGKETQTYVVEAWLNDREEGQPARLQFIGDTGPELMLFRRSFPFHATLAKVGEAVCKTEKPVS